MTGGAVAFMLLVVGETLFPPAAGPVLPLAGLSVADGTASLVPTVVLATVAATVGASIIYEVARVVGADRVRHGLVRHCRWTRIEPDRIERAETWFRRHADVAVLFGRCVPGLRSLVSIPAGLERMSRLRFVVLTAIGNLLWCSLVIGAAAAFGDHVAAAQRYAAPLQGGVLLLWVLVIASMVVRARWKHRATVRVGRLAVDPAGTGGPADPRRMEAPDPRATDVPT